MPLLALIGAALLVGCGGDFEFKTSGDRTSEGNVGPSEFNNPDAAGLGGASTASDEKMKSIQEQYQAKLKAESGKP
ncbi:MAG: hypothetical protein F4Y02_06435 [Chloroflexi bacterium]|nr:hypothetical protein [Chloroflexota bacterium]MYD93318.1 hypothetical protein [Chloroflexota bacterium]